MTKRDLVVVLLTFCLSAVLFFAFPTRSQTSREYDPWADVSGPTVGQPDGTINMRDIQYEIMLFNTIGTPINRTDYYLKTYTNWHDGLVGYWKFDDGTGNITFDSSGNGNDGTLIDDPVWVDGKYGKALSLNGTNYVEIADSESLEVQNFTLEAWIYMTKRPYQQSNAVAIIHKYTTDAESSGSGYMLLFQNPTPTDDNLVLASGYAMAGERILAQYNSTIDLSLDEWHHVAGTFDGYTATIYIDGIPRKSMTYSQHIEIFYWKSIEFRLGRGMSEGLIDNALIYNRTLSAEEVLAHYVLPPP